MSDELEDLLGRVHDGITTFDFEGKKAPCIVIDGPKYESILARLAGQPFSVSTDLNILRDGRGHVFVEVLLVFSRGGISEKFLVNAATDIVFFECLAETGMLALSSRDGADSVFAVQLPRPEKARDALEMIREGLAKS